MKSANTEKKLSIGIAAIVLMSLCLVVTSVAITYHIVSVDDNSFSLGTVDIDLNGGEPILNNGELVFEPGMTVKKEFYVLNNSTCDVYYKLYFTDFSGGLSEMLEVKICDEDKILYQGIFCELTRDKLSAADDVLAVGEKRDLQMYLHLPDSAGNIAQDSYLSFELTVDAVQTANNPDKNFD